MLGISFLGRSVASLEYQSLFPDARVVLCHRGDSNFLLVGGLGVVAVIVALYVTLNKLY